MKRILLLCIIALLASCSKDDDTSIKNTLSINPPNWIIGTWGAETSMSAFRFTQDDLVIISMTTEISMKEQLKSMAAGGAEIEETADGDSYELRFITQGVTQVYLFTRVDENSIYWVVNGMDLPLERQ